MAEEGEMSSLDETFRVFPGDPMRDGVRRDGARVCFTMRIPEDMNLELLLYRENETTPSRVIPYPASDRIGNISSVSIYADPADAWYNYRVNGEIIPDPCAVRVKKYTVPGTEKQSWLCAIPSDYTAETEPLQIPMSDSVFYKLHVRGFTMKKTSGVRHRSTFAGVSELIPELKDLGVTSVILMPVYEFRTEEEKKESSYMLDSDVRVMSTDEQAVKNYWGYSRGLYFAPKASYSSSGDSVREFGDMVDALHRNGLECIPEFYFEADEDPRVVTDVLRYWRFVYHVDGFHLVGYGNWIQAVTSDPMLVRSKLIYTYFNTGEIYRKGSPRYCNLACMNLGYEHIMRRFLKGDTDLPLTEVQAAMRSDSDCCAKISYFADQDGFTMNDMVSYSEKHNEENGEKNKDGTTENFSWNCGAEGPSRKAAVRKLRMRQLKNAFLMLMTGQPSPMIYAGDEVMNSQGGNNNAWCQDNETGWVTWPKSRSSSELRKFVQDCIAFRKHHPVLHQPHMFRMSDYRGCGFPDLSYHSRIAWMSGTGDTKIGFAAMYCGNYAEKEDGTKDQTIYIAYNMYWKKQDFALPHLPGGGKWYLKADTSRDNAFLPDGQEEVISADSDKTVPVQGRSIVILVSGR